MSRSYTSHLRRWVGEKMYYERIARRKDAPDRELREELRDATNSSANLVEFEYDESGKEIVPTYRWEAGYRGDDESPLEFWQDTCSCDVCGRFLPAGTVSTACGWNERGYYTRNVALPVAHVDHEGQVCKGGQSRATPGVIVFSIEEVAEQERLDREYDRDCMVCGLHLRWCECGASLEPIWVEAA